MSVPVHVTEFPYLCPHEADGVAGHGDHGFNRQ